MKLFYTLFFICFSLFSHSQIQFGFEEIELPDNGFLNGSDMNGGFEDGPIFLPNNYNASFNSFTGFAISNLGDTTTPGFGNQFSSYTGKGAADSENFAVAYAFDPITLHLVDSFTYISSISVTNNTYAALSMKEGDNYTKKFGGIDGNDPDFYMITIKAFNEGGFLPDSINVYLADFRFEDNSMDYILDEWIEVDLSQFGELDSLQFTLRSSDNGAFGMNTPAYFCLDNVEITPLVNVKENQISNFSIYPNPAIDYISVKGDDIETIAIYNIMGEKLFETNVTTSIDVSPLSPGRYLLKALSKSASSVKIFEKE